LRTSRRSVPVRGCATYYAGLVAPAGSIGASAGCPSPTQLARCPQRPPFSPSPTRLATRSTPELWPATPDPAVSVPAQGTETPVLSSREPPRRPRGPSRWRRPRRLAVLVSLEGNDRLPGARPAGSPGGRRSGRSAARWRPASGRQPRSARASTGARHHRERRCGCGWVAPSAARRRSTTSLAMHEGRGGGDGGSYIARSRAGAVGGGCPPAPSRGGGVLGCPSGTNLRDIHLPCPPQGLLGGLIEREVCILPSSAFFFGHYSPPPRSGAQQGGVEQPPCPSHRCGPGWRTWRRRRGAFASNMIGSKR